MRPGGWMKPMTAACTANPTPVRLVVAAPDAEMHGLMDSLLAASLQLVPIQIECGHAGSRHDLMRRARANQDDLVMLDWSMAEAGTPEMVREMLGVNPRLRVIVLLPLKLRQYRHALWEAGVCSSIPTENLDAEWLSSALCLITRAMERERRVLASLASA